MNFQSPLRHGKEEEEQDKNDSRDNETAGDTADPLMTVAAVRAGQGVGCDLALTGRASR
jgi:hypothetical protein